MYQTDMYEGMLAETVTIHGANGDVINAYFARPLGPGPFPGMVVIHHMPGWDEWYREATRKFAHHGYAAISPNLYYRAGHGTPEDVAARVRAEGGVPDDQAVGDIEGAMKFLRSLPYINGKVGVFGTCSGGRHAYLAACRTQGFDAAVDCWGGRVVMSPEELTPKQPVAPIDYTPNLSCPLLGLFGEEDRNPTPEQVARHEEELKKYNKVYEFHMYPGAGHGFFYYDRPNYRQAQAVDGWKKIFAFLEKYLSTPTSSA
ncbi:dienelactone hydrolase family protein [Litorilinea aerophila]|uniref:Dienelactone hydrolase family protein n=1 Tax=Litorilinea aerophila TaxID=1204385 RepID=A0A540VMB4_9CHLR|nr:dienelactone hydrolase family protein [Litorilinea aerophila]MCC9074605.1 dienelactone hydrolase family protein [Litorilinea aerophila]OUC07479.1 carboxymethylenebutenolidase [Litorilinea aerophila]